MYQRDRTSPITLSRDTPVAQAKIYLPLGDGPHPSLPRLRGRVREGAHLVFQPFRDFLLGLFDGHAVEEA